MKRIFSVLLCLLAMTTLFAQSIVEIQTAEPKQPSVGDVVDGFEIKDIGCFDLIMMFAAE